MSSRVTKKCTSVSLRLLGVGFFVHYKLSSKQLQMHKFTNAQIWTNAEMQKCTNAQIWTNMDKYGQMHKCIYLLQKTCSFRVAKMEMYAQILLQYISPVLFPVISPVFSPVFSSVFSPVFLQYFLQCFLQYFLQCLTNAIGIVKSIAMVVVFTFRCRK